MTRTKLLLLGTGTPSQVVGRHQSSAVLIVDDTPYVVDCGSGTLERLIEARAQGIAALDYPNVTKLFITHLHADHTTGLPALIIGDWMKGRVAPLRIYGPKGTRKLAAGILDIYAIGIDEHQYRGTRELPDIVLQTTEITEGIIYEDKLVTVEAFLVQHGQLEVYGLKFVTPDKVVVFSSDTCALPIMVEKAKGCDILVHEAYCEAGMAAIPQRWQDYFATVHTSGHALGKIAQEAQPKLLVLTHQIMFGGTEPAELIREIRGGGFTGEIAYGNDLDMFE